jgi:hypothetical protein
MWIIIFSTLVVLIILAITIGTTIGLKEKGNTPETVLRTTTTTTTTTDTTTTDTTTTSTELTGIVLRNKM